MKEFMFIVFDRYDVIKSSCSVFESEIINLEDVLISKLCEIWELSFEEFVESGYVVRKSDVNVGIDCEEESYLLVEI